MNSTIFYLTIIIVILFLYRDKFKKKPVPSKKMTFEGQEIACIYCKNEKQAIKDGICTRGAYLGYFKCGVDHERD